jgi:hypothetical protein
VPDAAILFEWADGSYGSDLSSRAVAFEEEPVARLDAEQFANLVRHRDLSLARDSGLFLHGESLPYFIIHLLTFAGERLVLVIIGALFNRTAPVLWVIAVLSTLTVIHRMRCTWTRTQNSPAAAAKAGRLLTKCKFYILSFG